MSEKTCIVCGTPLTGKQKKYCSQKCSRWSNYRNNHEKLLEYHQDYQKNNKDRIKKQRREYYLKNRDKLLEYQKNYYQKHKQAVLKYQQDYSRENKEKINAYRREHYKKNRVKINDKTCIVCGAPLSGRQTKYCSNRCSQRDHYYKDPEKHHEYQRNYYKRNKEKYREYHRNYQQKNREKKRAYDKAYKRGETHEYKWCNEYEKLYFKDPIKESFECEYCLYFDTCDGKENCEYKKENL